MPRTTEHELGDFATDMVACRAANLEGLDKMGHEVSAAVQGTAARLQPSVDGSFVLSCFGVSRIAGAHFQGDISCG